MSDNRPFLISTDSSCDLPQAYYGQHNVVYTQLTYTINGTVHDNFDPNMNMHEFYEEIRHGALPVTQQVNPQQAFSVLEPYVQQGYDILHIAFSSGLSGSCNSAAMAAAELHEKYPEAAITVVDTLAASLGQGLLVHKAVKMKERGAGLQEIASWLEENKLHMVHNFTVDDLNHLHRGGRVSKTAAILGTALGIKPVMHMDDAGHLIPLTKVRGRRTSLDALVTRMTELCAGWNNDEVFISHGDCLEDAHYVAEQVRRRTGIKNITIGYVGPVIGAHSGPGTVALFFMGEHR